MTVLIVLALLVALVAILRWEERSWQRALRRYRDTPHTLRCIVCPGAPFVDDIATHTRLCHQPRERAAEDSTEWSNQ